MLVVMKFICSFAIAVKRGDHAAAESGVVRAGSPYRNTLQPQPPILTSGQGREAATAVLLTGLPKFPSFISPRGGAVKLVNFGQCDLIFRLSVRLRLWALQVFAVPADSSSAPQKCPLIRKWVRLAWSSGCGHA